MQAQNKIAEHPLSDQDVSTSEILGRVSIELHELTATTIRIQSLVSNLVSQSDTANRDNIYSLQELDRITQTLDNLTSFLAYLSNNTILESHVNIKEAAKMVKLTALATNLIHGAKQIEIEDSEEGECEFF